MDNADQHIMNQDKPFKTVVEFLNLHLADDPDTHEIITRYLDDIKDEFVDYIKGMAGFIKWSLVHGYKWGWIFMNLAHDIASLFRRELVSPRTSGYVKYFPNPLVE